MKNKQHETFSFQIKILTPQMGGKATNNKQQHMPQSYTKRRKENREKNSNMV